jgi:hypothetical protein
LRALPWDNDASNPEAIETSRTFRRMAMRRAHAEISALSADTDLAHFLRIGSSREDAPTVRDLCDQLTQLLAFKGIREPDPELLLAAAVLEPGELLDLSDNGMTARHPTGEL